MIAVKAILANSFTLYLPDAPPFEFLRRLCVVLLLLLLLLFAHCLLLYRHVSY